MNLADIIILLLIAAAVFLAVRSIRKTKKNGNSCCGGSSCCGSCSSCMQGGCKNRKTK